MPDFFQKFLRPFRSKAVVVDTEPPEGAVDLTKPIQGLQGLDERRLVPPAFQMTDDQGILSGTFLRLEDSFKKRLVARSHLVRAFQLEFGFLPGGRRYIYASSWGGEGYLIERAPAGWLISRCEKIVHQGTFIRSSEPIDQVMVYVDDSDQSKGGRRPPSALRLGSTWFGPALMTFSVYEQELHRAIDLEGGED